jgi:hypothetical protein
LTADPETCPHCGSTDLAVELRDAWPKAGKLPPPQAYGRWNVCQACGREWQDDDENDSGS